MFKTSKPESGQIMGIHRQVEEPKPPLSPLPNGKGTAITPHADIAYPANAISVNLFPLDNALLCLYVPPDLVPEHLSVVKSMHGRRWEPQLKVWAGGFPSGADGGELQTTNTNSIPKFQ
jgi:hypothetical protein